MAKDKTINSIFLHYGVQSDDMQIIEQACRDNDIDAEWLKEQILKPYNSQRNDDNAVKDEKADEKEKREKKMVNKILKKALKNIPS
ncbi:MAG: hypothetical protein SPL96_06160 [Bacteroidales bacterium]|nr:hypothetical protein [Bacteroidales bacterium]